MKKNNYMSSEFVEAIKKARGDRSIRAYAAQAGVNPATISRIEKGEYIPSNDILGKLTERNAMPQNGITYEDLKKLAAVARMENAGKEVADIMGIAGGAIAAMGVGAICPPMWPFLAIAGSSATSAVAKLRRDLERENKSPSEKVKTQDKYEKYRKKHRAFQISASSLIYESLGDQDIIFKLGKKEDSFDGPSPDTYLQIMNSSIKEWWFQFEISEDSNVGSIEIPAWARAHTCISQYLRYKSDSTRKISVVTNNKSLFDELSQLKDQNSFRGNFSVILIDDEELRIIDEIDIAYYSEGGNAVPRVI